MTYHALISPQGHVEYNAEFVVGSGVDKLEHGRWYAPVELAEVSTAGVLMADGSLRTCALFLADSSCAVEKNIKKWRYERQGQ